jgi:hypothetical protein
LPPQLEILVVVQFASQSSQRGCVEIAAEILLLQPLVVDVGVVRTAGELVGQPGEEVAQSPGAVFLLVEPLLALQQRIGLTNLDARAIQVTAHQVRDGARGMQQRPLVAFTLVGEPGVVDGPAEQLLAELLGVCECGALDLTHRLGGDLEVLTRGSEVATRERTHAGFGTAQEIRIGRLGVGVLPFGDGELSSLVVSEGGFCPLAVALAAALQHQHDADAGEQERAESSGPGAEGGHAGGYARQKRVGAQAANKTRASG